ISSYYSVISTCDVWPQYVGGDDSLEDYFYYHVHAYEVDKQVVQGNVFAGFVIDTLGSISNIKIIHDTTDEEYGKGFTYPNFRHLGSSFSDRWDEDAIEVIKGLKKFKPATLNGQKVNAYVVLRWSLYKTIRYPEDSYILPTPPKISGGEGYIYKLLNSNIPNSDALPENMYTGINLNFSIDTLGTLLVEDPFPNRDVEYLPIYKHAVNALRSIQRKFVPAQDEEGNSVPSYYSVWLDFYHHHKKFFFDRKLLFLYKASRKMAYHMPEKDAAFPGGHEAMDQYLKDNLVYPEFERQDGIQGRTCVRVTLDENGVPHDAKIRIGMTEGMNKESIRLANSLPPFIPAENYGKKVRSYYFIWVSFRL
ncbi:MAG: energy transducer TonB, partial [Chitinophagales bacterium]|nr:energy transducer TonB [Chitinophagales bacterium]